MDSPVDPVADTTATVEAHLDRAMGRAPEAAAAFVADGPGVTGHLFGDRRDGSAFGTNRCVDGVVRRGRQIVGTQVWTDSAVILRDGARLSEVPL